MPVGEGVAAAASAAKVLGSNKLAFMAIGMATAMSEDMKGLSARQLSLIAGFLAPLGLAVAFVVSANGKMDHAMQLEAQRHTALQTQLASDNRLIQIQLTQLKKDIADMEDTFCKKEAGLRMQERQTDFESRIRRIENGVVQ